MSNDRGLIELEKISKVYIMGNYEVAALREVNLRIMENEYVAIMGPFGFGEINPDEYRGMPGYAQRGKSLVCRRACQQHER